MLKQNLISIIIPTYNRPHLLQETLDSIIAQTYQNWECLLIDDGSLDITVKVLKNYAQKDKRFRVFERKNFIKQKGANACRNIGIENASGEYLIFFDSDDLFLPNCLQDRINFFESNNNYDFVVFQVQTFSKKENYKSVFLTIEKDNYLQAFLSHNLPWQTMAPMFKTSFIKTSLRFDLKMPRLQDPDFYTSLLLKENINFKILSDKIADTLYRITEKEPNLYNGLLGFYLYIKKYSKTDSKIISKEELRRSLKQCYLKSYNYFKLFYKKGSFKNKKIILKLTIIALKNKLITSRDFIVLTSRIILYKK